MPGEAFVDVSYRGIELGARLKLSEIGPRTAYLEIPKPMPVGTRVHVTIESGQTFGGRVLRVNEQVAGAERPAGMRIEVDALDGDVKAWWDGRVSVTDPAIPEPSVAGGQERSAGEEAVPEEAAGEEAVPEPTTDDMPTAKGRKGAKRTMIMSTDEIRAAIEAGGQQAELSDGVPDAVDGDSTDRAHAAQDDAESDDEDDGSNGDPRVHAQKHKKRRRKKRKTRG